MSIYINTNKYINKCQLAIIFMKRMVGGIF